MSSDPRDYHYRSSRDYLPPLRDVLGDALDSPARSSYRFDFEDVNRALPGSVNHERFQRSAQHYLPERGPTLPPIRHLSSRDHSSSGENSPARSTAHPTRRDRPHDKPEALSTYTYSTPTNPQPSTGPVTYSYNVLRAQQGDLVDVRTPSSRAQGILRPTAIIEDEDESHKRYKCDWPGCEKKYDRPSSLEVHRHTHTGSQPYPCQFPGCNRAFNVKSNMLRHFRSHPQAPRAAGKLKVASVPADDAQSDDEEEDGKWPDLSSSRHFHKMSSSTLPPSSSTARDSVSSGSTPHQYYSSSRRR